jgi:HAD superfamily hydrolase (TIGR01549 family)
MFQNLLFDIDNTIFNFSHAEQIALERLFTELEKKTTYSSEQIKKTYHIQKQKFQNCAGQTASSHSKYLQLKTLFDKLAISLNELKYFSNYYDEQFKENIVLYENCREFLEFCKSKDIKLYCLSNNTSREQIERVKHAGLLDLFTTIYTSEEFGLEKPDSKLYSHVLHLLNGNIHNTAMVGDSFENDILGSNYTNMYAFWFHKNNIFSKTRMEFNSYEILLEFFRYYYLLSTKFETFSKRMGERFDLVQAGGGNTSFKLKDHMFIKSSGCGLSEISINKNYVGVQYQNIKNSLKYIISTNKRTRETDAALLTVNEIQFLTNYKPSIETTMHALTNKFTVHLHPIQFNLISGKDNCKSIVEELFPGTCFVDYFTPGIDVALELLKIYNNESIIFLKNHGVVFTSDSVDILYQLIEDTILTLEQYLSVSFIKYKFVNKLSTIMEDTYQQSFVSYLSEDIIIDSFINTHSLDSTHFHSFFPDKVVYCGNDFVLMEDNLKEQIIVYGKKTGEIPKIFIKREDNTNLLYICSTSLKKCLDIESVLKSHFICFNVGNNLLSNDEINYLNNWDAEKYRKFL